MTPILVMRLFIIYWMEVLWLFNLVSEYLMQLLNHNQDHHCCLKIGKTNINHDRYKIIYDGGLVSKTDDEFYFQNESESRRILEFRSGTFIKTGNNVTSTIPSGDYTLQKGADLSLLASQYVSLEPGFSTEVGSTFLASTDNVIVAQCPPQRKGIQIWVMELIKVVKEFNVFDFFKIALTQWMNQLI